MYIKNLRKITEKLGFTTILQDDNVAELWLKVNDKKQILIVSTDFENEDVMFISEHKILKPNDKKFEDDHKNYEILSECITTEEFWDILQDNDVIKMHKVIEDFDALNEDDIMSNEFFEDQYIYVIYQDIEKTYFKSTKIPRVFYQYNYTIEDKIEKI
jgi:hypothetical protein